MADFDINTLTRRQASSLNPYIDTDSFSTTLCNVCVGLAVIQDIDADNDGMRESTNLGINAHCQALISALSWESQQPAKRNQLNVENPDHTIQSRDDLSFTSRDSEGRLNNWDVQHDWKGNWSEGRLMGEKFFDEVRQLALFDERAAFHAIKFATDSSAWRSSGWGIEGGFIEALARAAMIGIRELQKGAIAFDEKAHTN